MTYSPRFKPYDHQLRALSLLEGREAFALFMEMRTGKTKTVLDDFGRLELAGEADCLLVIAPGGVYRGWEEDIKKHLSEDLLKRALVLTWQSNRTKTFDRLLAFFMESKAPRILLMNIEALAATKTATQVACDFLSSAKSSAMAVVDESTAIKRYNSKRTEIVVQQIKPLAKYRRILSGLPTPQSPLDLFGQFEFLNPRILGHRTYQGFRTRFAKTWALKKEGSRRKQIIVNGYKDLDELQERIKDHVFRVQLSDCYDLPDKIYLRRDVFLTPEQDKAYSEMLHFCTTQLENGSHVTATVVIAQIIKLHQILCGFVGDELGQRQELPEKRTDEVLACLEEHPGKAVIWCAYDPCIRKVTEALKKEYGEGSVARFWGGNRATREAEEKVFLNDPDCRFMVATAAAGGRGRTWTNANLTIYHSCTPDLEHRSQSEERTQGIGKSEHNCYVDLMTPGHVEEKYIKLLRKKIDLASQINGDNYKEWLI